MIYIIAVFLPPLALLFNRQPLSALINLIIIVPCLFFGLVFWPLFLIPSIHAVIAVHMGREDRKHRELLEAVKSPTSM